MAHPSTSAAASLPAVPAVPTISPIPLRVLAPWLAFIGVVMLAVLYFVGAEQGATSLISGTAVHEFFHDGRHLLGFPCH